MAQLGNTCFCSSPYLRYGCRENCIGGGGNDLFVWETILNRVDPSIFSNEEEIKEVFSSLLNKALNMPNFGGTMGCHISKKRLKLGEYELNLDSLIKQT